MRNFPVLLVLFEFLQATSLQAQQETPPKREFRAVWIATVANIDWPSSKKLNVEAQKAEAIEMLNKLAYNGFNAVFLQVRCAADALYEKSIEPWSEWLTSKQGMPPQSAFDPLEFFIAEGHKRSIEVHAWLNPYRAIFNRRTSSVAGDHITKRYPGWFFPYGQQLLFNPGIPAVKNYIVRIVKKLANDYDIDGLHLDDYFYPYPEKGQRLGDKETFEQFGGNFTSIDEWRRDNVNQLVHQLHDTLRSVKPFIKFGISPFGVWQNKSTDEEGSNTRGLSTYLSQYADSRKWLKNGWVDYLNPQIYFTTESPLVPYDRLLNWWADNRFGRLIYAGIGAYRAGHDGGAWMDGRQLPLQVRLSRVAAGVEGQVYFSAKSILNNPLGFSDSLRIRYYKRPALTPVMPWIDSVPPNAPIALTYTTTAKGEILLNWNRPPLARDGEGAFYYAVYRFADSEPVDIQSSKNLLAVISKTAYSDRPLNPNTNYFYVVTALDRMQNESLGTCNIYIPSKTPK